MGFLDFIAPGQKNRTAVSATATQMYLRIAEIRDNVLVLKNGGLRLVLKASSINFNLKSEEEQKSILFGYQGFLNSLEFPIQIVIRSKKLNIDNYIENVRGLAEKQSNPLLQEQTYEYADYIKKLVEYADIMDKEFYLIIPYDPLRTLDVKGNGIQAFFQRLAPKDSYSDIKHRHAEFSELKKGLLQRLNVVETGLENCGIKTEQLNTLELSELFYNSYNPSISRNSKLKDFDATSVQTDEESLEEEDN